MDEKQDKKTYKFGKFEISKNSFESIVWGIILILLVVAYSLSPRVYSITTGLYNQSTIENQKNVEMAMGIENTEERFRLYFQWYNVIHELGHGLLYYNNGVRPDIADEEQLVNDFAVAYWKYYGEEEKINELYDIVSYAVKNVGDNYEKGVNYLEVGKENSNGRRFKNSFFNFNDYGWFQFSSVKHSIEANKSLEEVLKEMGFTNFELKDKKRLVYNEINEEVSTKIINDAVDNMRSWGLEFPGAVHYFNRDPNNNYSRSMVKFLGIIEIVDYIFLFS